MAVIFSRQASGYELIDALHASRNRATTDYEPIVANVEDADSPMARECGRRTQAEVYHSKIYFAIITKPNHC
jgi:hypothetical protein